MQLLDTPDEDFMVDLDVDIPSAGTLTVYLNGVQVAARSGSTGGMIPWRFDVTSGALKGLTSAELELTFNAAAGQVAYLDNVAFIPEPTSIALIALGGLALLRRRRE